MEKKEIKVQNLILEKREVLVDCGLVGASRGKLREGEARSLRHSRRIVR